VAYGIVLLYVDALPQPDFILPHLILNADLPVLGAGLFCTGALSASMSKGDALLHASASVLVEDGVRPFRSISEAARRPPMRILIVLAGGVAYFFALDEDQSLVVLLLRSYGIIAQLAPPVVTALFWRRATTVGVLAGLVAGSAVTLFFFLNPGLRPWDLHEGILGLLVHPPFLVAGSILTAPQSESHVEPS